MGAESGCFLEWRSHDTQSFALEGLDEEVDDSGSHMVVVGEPVAAGGCLQVALEGNADGCEFHSQAVGAIVPAGIARIAAEELVARPVERVDVKDRRILAGGFGVVVHLEQRIAFFRFVDAFLEVDGRRNGGDGRKQPWEQVSKSQGTLTSHAGSQQRDSRRLGPESLANEGQDVFQDVLLS